MGFRRCLDIAYTRVRLTRNRLTYGRTSPHDGGRVQEYLAHGVESVWVIDPDERSALSYSPVSPAGALGQDLRTENPAIHIPLAELLSALD
jgi:hypothetical protein